MMGALITRLRSFSEITALVGTSPPRVASEFKRAWTPAMPTYAIRLNRAGGRPSQIDSFRKLSRVDVFCYGPDITRADMLMEIVEPALCPGAAAANGFVQSGCVFFGIEPETDAIVTLDPDTKWPYAWMPFIVDWSVVPVP